ncbi:hypothetical protein [Flavobacterium panici]|uniref:Uncharacterized protein n=1 Tax=Flavobacterium panici TaxID=2654843 RepID=A0A9N8IY89_9FLAO|nr:hypothetical protein [Flavobacterium panici]CAC9972621.1 hypothetical protein FLAPXU55_00297 [Flavobacterium panici]
MIAQIPAQIYKSDSRGFSNSENTTASQLLILNITKIYPEMHLEP